MTRTSEPTPALLTGVIVTYRSESTITSALAAARRCREAGVMETVVVDNNTPPPDRTREILSREAGFARVVLGERNIGFGRGCNRGLAEVRTPYVIFINPDGVLEPDAVRTLVAFLESHPRCAICGPAIAHGGDAHGAERYWHAGGALTPGRLVGDAIGLHSSMKARREVRAGDAPFQTDWVSGAMFAGRTSVLRELGGFDPRFFLYFEETDLCRRAMRAGYQVWCVPGAVAAHVGGVSAAAESDDRIKGCIAPHYYQSRSYYLRKQFGIVSACGAELIEYLAEPAVMALRAALGREHAPIFRRWKYPLWKLPRPAEEVAPL